MKVKTRTRILILISAVFAVALCSLIVLSGCKKEVDYSGMVKVVYELEGGKYQNCENMTHYYAFEAGSQNLIKEPASFAKKEFVREGYTLEGWYKQKIVSDDGVTYIDKWNFESDKVGDGGIVLYAHWQKNVKFSYNVCYRDGDAKLQSLGTYDVDEGMKFKDHINYAKKRAGYTAIGFLDEDGNPWDEDFKHPGGEEDLTINVLVNYIEGDFELVSTLRQLKSSKNKNIYLLDDIDFGGEEFFGFDNYNKKFYGNDHKIFNFRLKSSSSKDSLITDSDLGEQGGILCVSLFGNIKNAEIKDLKIENVTVEIDTGLSLTKSIIVAPLCVKATNSKITGVTFSGEYKAVKLPSGFDKAAIVTVCDAAYYFKDAATTVSGFSCEIADSI